MEYVFELDVSGKVEDVVETLLQVSQHLTWAFTRQRIQSKLRQKLKKKKIIFIHLTKTTISFINMKQIYLNMLNLKTVY